MIEKLELLYNEIQEEAMITSQTITQFVEKEMRLYHWNIGRIILEAIENQIEFHELCRELQKRDCSLTAQRLLEYMNCYQNNPDVEELIF